MGKTVRVKVDWFFGNLTTRNVIAETRTGDPENTIVVGAHLDSVSFGPGINDNGSGSGGILEIAEQLEKTKLRNQIRFMWFSAEESGLLGSTYYVEHLTDEERADIAAMLNFDMIASPNFVRFVYDGDLSDTVDPGEDDLAPAARPGSAAIEDVFLDYFGSRGLATDPTDFDGRSDYGPFIAAGIPAGGLFTGAEEIKTAEQAAIYGGAAGVAFDPCYHAACDTLDNLNMTGLEQMADAAAHATLTLGMNTESINGRPGKGNFKPDAPAPDAASRSWRGCARPIRPAGSAVGPEQPLEPHGEPVRQVRHVADREDHAGHERRPVRGHVAQRQRLRDVAEDDVLVGDQALQPDGVDRHLALHQLRGALRRARRRVELGRVVVLDDLPRGHVPRRLGGEAHHQHRADREVRGDERVRGRRLGGLAQRADVEARRPDHDVPARGEDGAARCRAPCRGA